MRGTVGDPLGRVGHLRFIPACAGNRRPSDGGPWRPAVHPRVCGEQYSSRRNTWPASGSSPRVRGTELLLRRLALRLRFIPACAGNSPPYVRKVCGQAVHPRVCGEQRSLRTVKVLKTGSSPRVRGTDFGNIYLHNRFRFIPACAGNSSCFSAGCAWVAVHPRVCGEQVRLPATASVRDGSSPRVRGTDQQRRLRRVHVRFIPACAGNRTCPRTTSSAAAVHPRVCGEQFHALRARPRMIGSSPRVRGTDGYVHQDRAHRRFIPACAGNSYGDDALVRASAVHPRVCGEQFNNIKLGFFSDGSSPRVRGTENRKMDKQKRKRFIPACAGNSFRAPAASPAPPVHPRVCGEQCKAYNARWGHDGSSPRVRGTDHRGAVRRQRTRFIPACAGNSCTRQIDPSDNSVHPRVCGEQRTSGGVDFKGVGSSPRVRGTGTRANHAYRVGRFIPACAGNSWLHLSARWRTAVHPRVCGEQLVDSGDCRQYFGSSPRVRGTGHQALLGKLLGRFIPACAGNSSVSWSYAFGFSVHPRVCGEQRRCRWERRTRSGSSPRVRGTGKVLVVQLLANRFIPACAGNSIYWQTNEDASTVHPRVCGEQADDLTAQAGVAGSSPRVRGTGLRAVR